MSNRDNDEADDILVFYVLFMNVLYAIYHKIIFNYQFIVFLIAFIRLFRFLF